MIIEVKKTVNSDILYIEPRNAIKLLIYCHYLMRLENVCEQGITVDRICNKGNE